MWTNVLKAVHLRSDPPSCKLIPGMNSLDEWDSWFLFIFSPLCSQPQPVDVIRWPDKALSVVCRSPHTLSTHSPWLHMFHCWGWICMQMEVLPVLYLLGPGWDFLIPVVWPLHSFFSLFQSTIWRWRLSLRVCGLCLFIQFDLNLPKLSADVVFINKYSQVLFLFRNLNEDASNNRYD